MSCLNGACLCINPAMAASVGPNSRSWCFHCCNNHVPRGSQSARTSCNRTHVFGSATKYCAYACRNTCDQYYDCSCFVNTHFLSGFSFNVFLFVSKRASLSSELSWSLILLAARMRSLLSKQARYASGLHVKLRLARFIKIRADLSRLLAMSSRLRENVSDSFRCGRWSQWMYWNATTRRGRLHHVRLNGLMFRRFAAKLVWVGSCYDRRSSRLRATWHARRFEMQILLLGNLRPELKRMGAWTLGSRL
jgi:hypothetical protein